jgi:hypothetical protein
MYRSRLAFVLAMAALAAILVPSTLPAQVTFQRTYGGTLHDYGYSVQQTADSGYVLTGYVGRSAGFIEVWLVKTDANGDTLWTRTFGGTAWDDGRSVQQTADGGYIVAGTTWSYGAGSCDVYLVRTDARGDTLWTKVFGGTGRDYGYSVQQTADDGFIIAGTTHSYGAGVEDVYLVKTDPDGDTLWTRTYGGSGHDEGWSVIQTADSGYIIAGYTKSFGAGWRDVYLIKTDALGDTQWTRSFGGTGNEVGCSVQQTTDSGYVIAGATESFGAGHADIYLIRTNVGGDTLWTKTFGGASTDSGFSVGQTTDSGYIIAGRTNSFGVGGGDAYLIKTDADGDTLWTKSFGGTGNEAGCSVQQTKDDGYIIVGRTSSFGAGSNDVYLIKTDSLGNVAVAEPKTSPTRASALSLTCEPNPSSGATTIRTSFIVPRSSLSVYDASGRRVRTFTVNRTPCTVWDGTDELGHVLPSGTYFAVLTAAGQHATARIVLQR